MTLKEKLEAVERLKSSGVRIENTDKIESCGDQKAWSLWADNFGEINAYYVTFEGACKMVNDAINYDAFEAKELLINMSKNKDMK